MNTINAKRPPTSDPTIKPHLNYMGGRSYFIKNPIAQLRLAAASSFFGEPKYYQDAKGPKRPTRVTAPQRRSVLSAVQIKHLNTTLDALDPQDWRGLDPTELMVRAIDAALDYSVEETLQEAVRLRNEDHIRVTPQVILVRAANHKNQKGTGLVGKYASQIVVRTDELTTGLAYQMSAFGKPIPNSLKKAWAGILAGLSEYQLAKYRMESKEFKLTDVVSLVHATSPAINKLMKDELRTTNVTWESIVSAEGSNPEAWSKAVDVMGHMALLRNVRNLLKQGLSPKLFTEKLKAGAPTGKQLPFRYFSAYKAVEEVGAPPQVLDAIEDCLELSIGNLPSFGGRVMSLCDNSGSAWGTATSSMGTMHVAEIANLTGILTAKASEEGYVGIFGDRLETVPIRKKDSTFTLLKELNKKGHGIGQSTENGIWLFWDKAIKNKEVWDHVFVYSDLQCGYGQLYGTTPSQYSEYQWQGTRNIDVPMLISKYRKEVNPNVMVYLVQVSGYQDTIIPEYYDKCYLLSGWSEGVLNFADAMSKTYQQ